MYVHMNTSYSYLFRRLATSTQQLQLRMITVEEFLKRAAHNVDGIENRLRAWANVDPHSGKYSIIKTKIARKQNMLNVARLS